MSKTKATATAAQQSELYPEEIERPVEQMEQLIAELTGTSDLTAYLVSMARMQLIEETLDPQQQEESQSPIAWHSKRSS